MKTVLSPSTRPVYHASLLFPTPPVPQYSRVTLHQVLREHVSGALMIHLEAPGAHGATASDVSSHTSQAVHDTAAYSACFQDNHMVKVSPLPSPHIVT